MRIKGVLLTALLALSAAAVPAGAATPTGPAVPAAQTWQSWSRLLDANAYDVPVAAGRLRGIAPTTRCGAPASDLPAAIARLGRAVGVDTAVAPGTALHPVTAAYLATVADCIATHAAHLPSFDGAQQGVAPDALRAQWLGTMADLSRLAKNVPTMAGSTAMASCVDTGCLVQVGGTGDDTYTQDAVVVLDEGGADTYRNNAGGAALVELRPAALLLDLGTGNDRYEPVATDLMGGLATNGSGSVGSVGVLVDQGGDDHYCGLGGTMGSGYSGGGLLIDAAGSDTYESFSPDADSTDCPWNAGTDVGQSHKSSHGAGSWGGFGFLVDGGGDDEYLNYGVDSMGWGGAAGTGVLIDAGAGTDAYTVRPARTRCGVGSCDHVVAGVSIGVGEVFGVGVVLDGGGSDAYGCYDALSYGCIGASSGGELGLVYDAGGDDTHVLGLMARGRAGGIGAAEPGPLPAGQSSEAPFPGVGVFVDVAGDDTYTAANGSAVGYATLASLGVFADLAGTDTYSVPGTLTAGARTNGSAWVSGVVGVGLDV